MLRVYSKGCFKCRSHHGYTILAMEGYHKLSRFMGQYDDCAIFKRFYHLNMQNLLYYQAEIINLEKEFNELAERDMNEPSRAHHHRHWLSLSWSEKEEDIEQWNKWRELRSKLKDYNDALAQVTNLSKLKAPDHHHLLFLQDWLERPTLGNFPLQGLEARAFKDDGLSGFVAVNQREEYDSLTKWFSRTFVPLYHAIFRKPSKKTVITGEPISEFTYYPEKDLLTLLSIIRTIIATLLPTISIITLYFVTNPVIRLGLVIVFTILFSTALMLVTQGRRVEVFAATSAFAAIQVVFISGNGGFVP